LVITVDDAELAGKFKKDYSEKGITLGLDDMLIAATAITSNYTFVTRNISHFPMPEIDLYEDLQSGN
jgi:predicted nucleic acid-binding protein